MIPEINIIGRRFGKLLVEEEAFPIVDKHGRWWQRSFCLCDCGKRKIIRNRELLRVNGTKSCSCKNRETNVTHGYKSMGSSEAMIGTHASWNQMLVRCTNQNNPAYGSYGGRGIKVCKRWLKFENFITDMGNRPIGTSIDRIDNNGNYCPKNCRWATRAEQNRNRRSNQNLTFNGQTMCATDWNTKLGFPNHLVLGRLAKGWSVEDALTRPITNTGQAKRKSNQAAKLLALQAQQQALQEGQAQNGTVPNDNGVQPGSTGKNQKPQDDKSLDAGDHTSLPALPR